MSIVRIKPPGDCLTLCRDHVINTIANQAASYYFGPQLGMYLIWRTIREQIRY